MAQRAGIFLSSAYVVFYICTVLHMETPIVHSHTYGKFQVVVLLIESFEISRYFRPHWQQTKYSTRSMRQEFFYMYDRLVKFSYIINDGSAAFKPNLMSV